MPAISDYSREVPRRSGGRLTLETGVPLSTTDQTAKTSVLYTPCKDLGEASGYVSIYDGSFWREYPFSELSLNLNAFSVRFQILDVFIRLNSGVASLAYNAWTQSNGNITSCTNATPVVLTVSSGHGVVAGDVIGLGGIATATSLNGHTYYVSGVTATTITLEDTVASGAGTGGTWTKVLNASGATLRTTSITQLNGVDVLSTGGGIFRWLGTVCCWDTAGQTEDSESRRLVWNRYNKAPRRLFKTDTTDSWTDSTTAWCLSNKAGVKHANSVYFIHGLSQQNVFCENNRSCDNSSGTSAWGGVGIGLDQTTVNVAQFYGSRLSNTGTTGLSRYSQTRAEFTGPVVGGLHAFRDIRISTGGTIAWQGDWGQSNNVSGLLATVEG